MINLELLEMWKERKNIENNHKSSFQGQFLQVNDS